MWAQKSACSILYIVFTWLILMCSSFVILSSAEGENIVNLFPPGESLSYKLHSTVLLNEKFDTTKNVGFYIDGEIQIECIWASGDNRERVLKVQLKAPQLHIRSRKTSSSDGFVPHSSNLDNLQNKPFLIVWHKGRIEKILLAKDEPVSISNLKKGIASLFQFQLVDAEIEETDASGKCSTIYKTLSSLKIQKSKSKCISIDLPLTKNPDLILGAKTESARTTLYELHASNNYLTSIKSKEEHLMFMAAKEEVGNNVQAEQSVVFLKRETLSKVYEGDNLEQVLDKVAKEQNVVYTQESLLTEREPSEETDGYLKTLDALREHLKPELSGSLKPARAFIRMVKAARRANKEDISKSLGAKKNKKILHEIYDVLGFTQTQESHQAVMKKLRLENEDHFDLIERYLWALSLCSKPNIDIIEDLLHKFKTYDAIPEKLRETLVLTIASMTNRLLKISENNKAAFKLSQKVEEAIINELDYAKNSENHLFFRALKNLQSPSSIPKLLEKIKNGTQKEGVLAWKAIKSFNPNHWNPEVLKSAEKSFFQLDKKYDSSSRTLAADVLLESQPTKATVTNFLQFLLTNETAYEIKQYAFQRIKMIAEEDPSFKKMLLNIIKKNKTLNNYSALSPRGLSVSLKRNFLKSNSTTGSLVSVQEIKSGIAKRGIVNVVMEKNGEAKELFSLGIFSGGLSSFVSSNNEEEVEEEEAATAGMELTILGTQIRPFVFFNGQGELMGHVWSGTASEKTPAYQALILLQDHLEYLRLASGFIAIIDLKGAISFDLSGQIEISIWNRNAKSMVEKSAGIVTVGSVKIDSSFVKTQVEFGTSVEPKLSLQTDIDFSSNMNLCMRLAQPDALFRHSIFKIERIPGSKHKLRIAKYKKSLVSGTTYSLNKKNNEMCSAIFN